MHRDRSPPSEDRRRSSAGGSGIEVAKVICAALVRAGPRSLRGIAAGQHGATPIRQTGSGKRASRITGWSLLNCLTRMAMKRPLWIAAMSMRSRAIVSTSILPDCDVAKRFGAGAAPVIDCVATCGNLDTTGRVRIGHPSSSLSVDGEVEQGSNGSVARSVRLGSTACRLIESWIRVVEG